MYITLKIIKSRYLIIWKKTRNGDFVLPFFTLTPWRPSRHVWVYFAAKIARRSLCAPLNERNCLKFKPMCFFEWSGAMGLPPAYYTSNYWPGGFYFKKSDFFVQLIQGLMTRFNLILKCYCNFLLLLCSVVIGWLDLGFVLQNAPRVH